jgi:hypothetical protein
MSLIDFPFQAFLDDDAVAQLLDVKSLRPGYKEILDKSGKPIACINLASIWMLDVHPTFGPWGMIGVAVAHAEGDDLNLKPRNWVKGFLASADDFAVTEIPFDPLRVVLRLPSLLAPFDGCYGRDGAWYRLRTDNGDTAMKIVFDNPATPEWFAIEETCIALAKQIALGTTQEKLLQFANGWEVYFKGCRAEAEKAARRRERQGT